jgi:hypothetical protein
VFAQAQAGDVAVPCCAYLWLLIVLLVVVGVPVLAWYSRWLAIKALRKYTGKPPIRLGRGPWKRGDVAPR